MYHLGETEADIREGQDFPKLWATWHSDWSTPGTVTLTVVASDAMAAGGFMTLTATPTAEDGSSVHGVGTDLEEPHGAHGGDDDAVHRPAVPVVVLQVRRQRRQSRRRSWWRWCHSSATRPDARLHRLPPHIVVSVRLGQRRASAQ